MMRRFWYGSPYFLHYDNEEGSEGGNEGNESGGNEGNNEEVTTFTKEDLEKAVKSEQRKYEDQLKRQVEQLEKLQKAQGLTQKERGDLETQIEGLRTELMTKEQVAARDKEKQKKQFEEQIGSLTEDRNTWKERFETSTIINAIQKAAVDNEALSVDQIVALIKDRNPRLVADTTEDGDETGQFTPRVKLPSIDPKTGKNVELDLTIADAVKSMKEDQSHFNLFKSTAKSGLGMTGNNDSRSSDKPPLDNHAEYLEWRKRQKG